MLSASMLFMVFFHGWEGYGGVSSSILLLLREGGEIGEWKDFAG